MGEFFVCPICGNKDIRKIGYLYGKPYCRACISFKGNEALLKERDNNESDYSISYPLTINQLEVSTKLLDNNKQNIDSLLIAVCGAGKTEIVFETITYALQKGGRVGFSIPRRDVVIEIYKRLNEAYTKNKVIAVYGGHTDILEGDIICLTTHQLFRYEKYFDLLIIDEIDAFPFNGNEVLFNIMKRSIKGNLIMMSATPNDEIIKKFNDKNAIIHLNTRFHNHPLPVPFVVKKILFLKYIYLIKKLKEFILNGKPTFVFAPTIELSENVFKVINKFIKGGNVVHSKVKNRDEIISDFKIGKYKFLVTTAVLERGVTVKDLQVIVFSADHEIYDKSVLVQISGRVGRKIDAPDGEVIFICEKETEEIRKCINSIEESNKFLR